MPTSSYEQIVAEQSRQLSNTAIVNERRRIMEQRLNYQRFVSNYEENDISFDEYDTQELRNFLSDYSIIIPSEIHDRTGLNNFIDTIFEVVREIDGGIVITPEIPINETIRNLAVGITPQDKRLPLIDSDKIIAKAMHKIRREENVACAFDNSYSNIRYSNIFNLDDSRIGDASASSLISKAVVLLTYNSDVILRWGMTNDGKSARNRCRSIKDHSKRYG